MEDTERERERTGVGGEGDVCGFELGGYEGVGDDVDVLWGEFRAEDGVFSSIQKER